MNHIIAKYGLFLPTVLLKGERVFYYLKEYMSSQWLNRETILANQQEKLKDILQYARDHVPYYAETMQDIDTITASKNLNQVPPLTKEILKERKPELISKEKFYLKSIKTTGGSTGLPVTVYKESDAMARERAALWRGYAWSGVDIGDKQCRFWGVPLKFKDRMISRLIDIINNRVRISAFDFNEERLHEFYLKIQSFKPTYLYGYVSIIKILGQYIRDEQLQAIDSLQSIITTAEELTEDDRNLIEISYGRKVFNEYGSGEIGTIAHECEAGSLHICAENVFVEVVRENGEPCQSEELGELVVTELNGRMLPLIRYRIGDLGKLSDKKCSCGRELPILEGVFGRAYDVVTTPEGKNFHPAFFNYIFKEVKNKNLGVKQFQVIQVQKDTLMIHLVTEQSYSEKTLELLRNLVSTKMSPNMVLEFKVVKEIPRERSGKFRVVKGLSGT